MFGSTNPFGQSSSSPFGSQSVFGQTSTATTNPFAPKPFGSPNPFGAQTGSSIFGGTSTGVFGQPSTPAFGASTTPAFGSSTPAFGASSAPAFGSSSSFSGSSLFGQKPAFGGFGSSPSQSSPFGSSTFQQTQSAFGGGSVFGSTSPFGASSQPAFGASSTPAFGSTSTPAFGATSTPAFGAPSTPAFGATTTPAFGSTTTPAFGSTSTSIFGNTGSTFGVSSSPAFGSTPFGASTTSVFGASSTPAFGASTASTFGSPTVPAFGASSTPSFSFSSTPSFSQSTSTFGGSTFGATASPFGGQSSAFGAPTSTPAFGSPGFGQQPAGGTRIAPYAPTPEVDGGSGTQPAGKLESISAMPQYKDKSHEELRWEDYQRGDKGGPNPSGQLSGGTGFPAAQPNPFSTGTFGQQSAGNPFSSPASTNPFSIKPPGLATSGFGQSTSIFNSTFSGASSSPFGSTTTTPLFGPSSTPAFGTSTTPSLFGGTTTSTFSTPSLFNSTLPSSVGGLNFGNTQSAGLFHSTPSFGQTTTPAFGQPNAGFQQTTSAFGSSPFSTPSAFTGGFFSTSTLPSFSTTNAVGISQPSNLQSPFQVPQPAQTSSIFTFPSVGQTSLPTSGGLGNPSSFFNQGIFGQSAPTQSNMVMQPAPVTNPFGALPAMPQMSIGRVGSSPSIQYGISSMPVTEKPIQTRTSSLLVPRHLSQRRIKLPPRKYHPKADGLRVPFFADDEEPSSTPKADALFIPRENPRSLFIRPIEQWPERDQNGLKDNSHLAVGNGKLSEPSAQKARSEFDGINSRKSMENGFHKDRDDMPPSSSAERTNGFHGHAQKEADPNHINISGDATNGYKHVTDVEAILPKLQHPDYYTEPSIQELAAKERAEPGFCSRVKDFVVGRRGYGSIKFYGETDVRKLDLESIVQFNNREVIVYTNESKKPPVGQGLNKPAEVTLLNIKCVNKKTGQQYTEGPNVEKYKGMLKKKAQEQGAEFVSYDPVNGEWKFKVIHF